MSLSIGIVGLPNVGKSTLFNALTKAQNAQAANYPFCTIEPNKATVAVPDERVDALSAKVSPKKTIHASVDFIDIAGLVRGASKGEGLGNQFLGNIRECTAIVEVVRCFEDENITHVDGSVDPLRDIDTIETELLLADLQSVERRLEKLQKMAKGSKDAKAAAEIMQGLLEHLNAGNGARSFELPDNETFLQSWRELGLLTAKPVIYCANVDEAAVADGNDFVARVQQLAEERHSGFACICAKLEEELQGLSAGEQAEMLASYGISESGLVRIIRTGYDTLGLCSYFTAGPDEVRAWTIHKGWKAPQAAGVIHTDFERGFIRAEVVAFDDLMACGSMTAAKEKGLVRLPFRRRAARGRQGICGAGRRRHALPVQRLAASGQRSSQGRQQPSLFYAARRPPFLPFFRLSSVVATIRQFLASIGYFPPAAGALGSFHDLPQGACHATQIPSSPPGHPHVPVPAAAGGEQPGKRP